MEVVEHSVLTKNGKVFHGVFTSMFPRRCWSSDSKYIFFNSAQKYRVNSYAIDISEYLNAPRSLDELDYNITLFCHRRWKHLGHR